MSCNFLFVSAKSTSQQCSWNWWQWVVLHQSILPFLLHLHWTVLLQSAMTAIRHNWQYDLWSCRQFAPNRRPITYIFNFISVRDFFTKAQSKLLCCVTGISCFTASDAAAQWRELFLYTLIARRCRSGGIEQQVCDAAKRWYHYHCRIFSPFYNRHYFTDIFCTGYRSAAEF